ncbi:MAG TPA: tRNA preQ1(34) S-adenosylmethionine ribosyltransferase-isomerase QueA [Methylomirabilota bacterium]|nr:tRNA preQ1(34) S-adenosylmethionine ribosyltransferase-isomerase QueA [Methylomirabilota bacterium]
MRTLDFDYPLPGPLIAQQPATQRDASRLLIVERPKGLLLHRQFTDFPGFLQPNDVLVLNDSKVIPARLQALNTRTRGRFEVLLVEQSMTNLWWTMMRPGRRARLGSSLHILDHQSQPTGIEAIVEQINAHGHRLLRFQGTPDLLSSLDRFGDIPLPPYIQRPGSKATPSDVERYQTVYARPAGSVAAPTAGLHFTGALLDSIRAQGVHVCHVTLHVGLGTFAPVKADDPSGHQMHEEQFDLPPATSETIARARRQGGRIIAVGTTTVRVIETIASQNGGNLPASTGRTRIFIHPPFHFQAVDALLTNFHLPKSTLLMLVSAFASPGNSHGRDLILNAYREAIRHRYRFFSYGDAMLIL